MGDFQEPKQVQLDKHWVSCEYNIIRDVYYSVINIITNGIIV